MKRIITGILFLGLTTLVAGSYKSGNSIYGSGSYYGY